jgi:hypothetical protein
MAVVPGQKFASLGRRHGIEDLEHAGDGILCSKELVGFDVLLQETNSQAISIEA